ncbi:MAG: cotSA [Herbinix sp.]|nr:cotSA [Herbinix sp.]
MKILWLTNVPSPYRVDFFNELGKSCDLTVLFEKATSTERDESWEEHHFIHFRGVILKGIDFDVDKAVSVQMIRYLNQYKTETIVVSDLATPTGIMAIEYMKLCKIPYLLEGDGGFAGSGSGWKESLKKQIIKGAKAYLSTSRSHDEYFLTYGASKERLYRYPFTSIKEEDILPAVVDQEKKQRLKQKLGIAREKAILTVGQFIHRKGFDLLLKAAKRIDPNAAIVIIGGEPTERYYDLIDRLDLDNVYFVGYQSKVKLKEYFCMADVFVLPTREDIWGLVINEAMAYGLPVVTTNRCIAGLELIEDEKNGYIVPVGDRKKLAETINLLLNRDELRESIANHNLNKIREFTVERMAERHLEIFEELKR